MTIKVGPKCLNNVLGPIKYTLRINNHWETGKLCYNLIATKLSRLEHYVDDMSKRVKRNQCRNNELWSVEPCGIICKNIKLKVERNENLWKASHIAHKRI